MLLLKKASKNLKTQKYEKILIIMIKLLNS